MIDRAKLQHILEYAKQQRRIGLHCKVPPEDMVEIVEMAMLQGADGNSPVIPDGSTCKYCGGSGSFRWLQTYDWMPCPCKGCTELAAPQQEA